VLILPVLLGAFQPPKRTLSRTGGRPSTASQCSGKIVFRRSLGGRSGDTIPIPRICCNRYAVLLSPTSRQPGARAIVGTETSGPNAQVATGMTPGERLRWGLGNVSKVFPEMAENFEGGTSIVWDQEPWSLGAAAYYAPGEMTTMFPHVATVEGRVHFAGEHTSTLFVIEGAVQSGVRAAHEIGAPV
jgi:monoamine oxidase